MKMKNKILSRFFCLFAICLLIIGTVPVSAKNGNYTVYEVQNLIDGIVDCKLKQTKSTSVQGWIDGELTKNAGINSEWYIIALSQSGKYNFSSYEKGLKNYLENNTVYSASSRQKYALALIASSSMDNYISSVMDNSIGQQGVMSYIYGLHLLNNGYISNTETINTVKQKILSLQLSDGGWAIMGVSGDNDVTAMAVQSLAPYYKNDSSVKSSVDKALSLLSNRQLENGDYASYGVPNAESTAQVITALCSLGINCETDSRFIKNGNTVLDGLVKYQLSDGSFSHKIGGATDENATSQAFYSLVAYIRMSNNKSGLYILDNRNPEGLKQNSSSVTTPNEQSTSKNSSSGNKTENKTNESNVNDSENTTSDTLKNNENYENNKNNQNNQSDTTVINTSKTNEAQTTFSDESANLNSSENGESETTSKDISENDELESTDEFKSETNDVEGTNINSEKTNLDGGEDEYSTNKKGGSYKLWVCIIIFIISGVTALILYVKKKRNKKNFLVLTVVTVIAICFVIFTDFQSKESYYNGEDIVKEEVIGNITFSIRCDTVVNKSDSEYIPEDGIILDNTNFKIEENDTVYDILIEAVRKYKIQIENTGSDNMAYIAGINYLYEFDFGELSGWTYRVNGEVPSVGCDKYELKDGDKVEWIYTCELGKDIR